MRQFTGCWQLVIACIFAHLAHNTFDFMSEKEEPIDLAALEVQSTQRNKEPVTRYYGYVAITDEEIALENREELRRMNEIMAQ